MATRYEGLYAWMHAVFQNGTFTAADFRETFPSPAPGKVLADLRRLGYISRVARGAYTVVPPDEHVRRIVAQANRALDLPEGASRPYAYSRDTAIAIWVDFTYWTGFTRGFRPLHIDVRSRDMPYWVRYFSASGAPATTETSRDTLFGAVHVLHRVPVVRSVRRGGVRVVPREEAHAYAMDRPYLYEPVLKTLRGRAQGGR